MNELAEIGECGVLYGADVICGHVDMLCSDTQWLERCSVNRFQLIVVQVETFDASDIFECIRVHMRDLISAQVESLDEQMFGKSVQASVRHLSQIVVVQKEVE